MIRATMTVFCVLTLMLAAACAVFGPKERADVVTLAEGERVEVEKAFRRGEIKRDQYDAVMQRIDRILAAARDESLRDLWTDIGIGVGGVLLGAKGKAIAGAVGKAINKHRKGATA